MLLLLSGATRMVETVIKHSFVEVNGSSVHLKQYGQSAKNLLKQLTQAAGNGSKLANHNIIQIETESPHLVVFVPGNPGALGIYHDFLDRLSKQVRGTATTILAIGHNDFDHLDHVNYSADERIFIDQKELNFVEKTLAEQYLHEPHHVELQVLNKLIILKRLISAWTTIGKVTFVGHSIGCYVILRLLQDKQLASLHAHSILIHPALENLALTEKGRYFDRVFHLRFDLVMKLVAFLVDSLLPHPIKMTLTRHFCSREFVASASQEVLESMMQLACSRHLEALVEMAKSELANVKQLDCEQMIGPHVPKLRFLYAQQDHWVNGSHRRVMKRTFKEKIHIEERDTLHAFVMDPKTVIEYAELVANYVNQVPE